MTAIRKADIEKLLSLENGLCVSVFIPTHRVGAQVLEGGDQTVFKNSLRQARERLINEHKLSEAEAQELLMPAQQLLDNADFWRHQTEGLAVFITRGKVQHFNLPITVTQQVYVLDHFYVLPVLPALAYDFRFFLLVLDRNHVELLEATHDQIRPVHAGKLFPETMNEALKFDVKGHDQDFNNSTATVNGTNIVHGSGSSKGDEQHERVREWLLEVEHGLKSILHNEQIPLVLAGVDHVCAIFRNVSKYKYIAEGNVHLNPDRQNAQKLLEQALPIAEPLITKTRLELKARYTEVKGAGFGSEDVATVAAEAIHGRVNALFVQPGQPVWGRYNQGTAAVEVHRSFQPGDADLVNLAALKTMTQGGRVFVEEMRPSANGQQAQVQALFRY